MRVDSHQHFWIYNDRDYGWMADDAAAIRRDFLPEDFVAVSAASGITRSVAVQARQTLAETEWLFSLAETSPIIGGVVGWVDLRSGSVEGDLERLSANAQLKGVRHVVHDEPDDDFILGNAFRRGIGLLRRFSLTYDILIFSRHLERTARFVRLFPDQLFVVDHIGKPAIRDGEFDRWRAALAEVAAAPNVFCKLSGMVSEAASHRWTAETFRPYIDTVIELFGPERVMFGSDWPVCTLESDYAHIYRIVSRAIEELSADEQGAILGGSAERFYRLKSDAD
ncbi:MAG TPA: amidohydrolase family protein [Spirochaetia bacterium]|nr:amidohydrolase family protein [Spirochaetia bacterium]